MKEVVVRRRVDAEVTLHAARAGAALASRTFRGREPPACQAGLHASDFIFPDVVPERAIDAWIAQQSHAPPRP